MWWQCCSILHCLSVISIVLTLAGVRPLTLLSKHVKQSTLSTHSALEWLPALVTLIINQLENNAWTFAKHLSPMVWWSKCHWALGKSFLSISARRPMAVCHCQQSLWDLKRRQSPQVPDRETKLVLLPSVTRKLPPLVSQWLWILHLWTIQGCPPAIWIQLCPLPHFTPDPRTRMQMYLRTTSTSLSLPQPPSTPPSHHPPATTTAPTTSVSASQSLAFV